MTHKTLGSFAAKNFENSDTSTIWYFFGILLFSDNFTESYIIGTS